MYKGSYKNGNREDIWETYWTNGKLEEKGSFKDGKEEGEWEFYSEDGKQKNIVIYRNGSRVYGFPVTQIINRR
jgi:antitoxin component YwqK of YwqJK toxin-antitoxin module